MIYARSRRPLATLTVCALGCALGLGALALAATTIPGGTLAGMALLVGAAAALAVTVWAGFRMRAWPSGKLALFRDRLLVIKHRHEMRALWDRMETITLADSASWPSIRLTDRLTINLRYEPPLRFKPAEFGLDASSCRDLILRLRDDPALRGRLPEFDSARDLAVTPVVAGETPDPGL